MEYYLVRRSLVALVLTYINTRNKLETILSPQAFADGLAVTGKEPLSIKSWRKKPELLEFGNSAYCDIV